MINIYGVYLLDCSKAAIEKTKKAFPWRDNGFEVVGFNTDTMKAVEEILLLKPELVITEYQMPEMCAVSLMNVIKSAGLKSEFIILTVSWSVETMREFFQSGGLDYLCKPLEKQEAETALSRLRSKWITENCIAHRQG